MAFAVPSHLGGKALRTVPVSPVSSCRQARACAHAQKLRGSSSSRLPSAFCSTRKAVKARLSALQVVSGNVRTLLCRKIGRPLKVCSAQVHKTLLGKCRSRRYRKSNLRKNLLIDKCLLSSTFMQLGVGLVCSWQRSWNRYGEMLVERC